MKPFCGSPESYIGLTLESASGDMIRAHGDDSGRRAAAQVPVGGMVETEFLDLPGPVRLDCGRELHPIRIAYETYGTLSPARDNVILVCHALSGDAHAAGIAKTPPQESTRDGFGAEDRDRRRRRGSAGGTG